MHVAHFKALGFPVNDPKIDLFELCGNYEIKKKSSAYKGRCPQNIGAKSDSVATEVRRPGNWGLCDTPTRNLCPLLSNAIRFSSQLLGIFRAKNSRR